MSKITPGEWIVQEWEHKDNDGSLVTCGYQVVARQAERDELIEIILSCNMSEGVLADAILAAGFKRGEV